MNMPAIPTRSAAPASPARRIGDPGRAEAGQGATGGRSAEEAAALSFGKHALETLPGKIEAMQEVWRSCTICSPTRTSTPAIPRGSPKVSKDD